MRKLALLMLCVLACGAGRRRRTLYPSKSITLIVPYAAGGGSDLLGRVLAEGLRTRLKETVVVQNVGGAGGAVGSMQAAKAKPDGYTLLLNHIGLSTIPSLYKKLNFDPAGVLRIHRPLRRGADGDHGAQGIRSEEFRRAGRLCEGQQGEVHHGLVGHGQLDASLRHAVPGGARRADHHGAVQGCGPRRSSTCARARSMRSATCRPRRRARSGLASCAPTC